MQKVFERHPQGQTCRHCGQWKIEHHRQDGAHYCETPAESQAPASTDCKPGTHHHAEEQPA